MDSATVLQAAESAVEAIPPTLPSGTEQPGELPPTETSQRDRDAETLPGTDQTDRLAGSPTAACDSGGSESKIASSEESDAAATANPEQNASGIESADDPGNAAAISGAGDPDPATASDGDEATAEPATRESDEAAGRDAEAAAALKAEGNSHFVAGRLEEALALYEEAVEQAPLRAEEAPKLAAMHANRAACLLGLSRNEECIAACDDCLDLDPKYVKAMLRRVKALENLDMLEEAQQDYEDILEDFPGNVPAKQGLDRLRASQKEKEEKLKTEMLDKLKGVGNSLLGHFGLSLDNFKVDQDAKTGGYSINFQQGAGADAAAPAAEGAST